MIPLEFHTDLHSPHSNGNFERQDFDEGLEALSSSGPQKMDCKSLRDLFPGELCPESTPSRGNIAPKSTPLWG